LGLSRLFERRNSLSLAQDRCVTIGEVKQAPHRTVTRRRDEPKLEIGDAIPMEEGLIGEVLARYMRSGDGRNDVHYIVELRRETNDKAEQANAGRVRWQPW